MVALTKALNRIVPKTILVLGDLLLDTYTFGVTKRISPEAPVPVLHVGREETKAGGAGNVALNLITLGMKVKLLGRVGDDAAGDLLVSILATEGVDVSGVFCEKGFTTPTKTRCIAGAQQLLRVDREVCSPLSADIEKKILSSLSHFVKGVDLIAISDYAKGFLTDRMLRAVIDQSTIMNIPCIVDPKASDFQKYAGCTVLKPNESETLGASPNSTTLEEAASDLLRRVPMNVLMVTRSQAGTSLFYPSGKVEHYPVARKEVRDGTGAGDTVLAMVSAALASQIPLDEAVPLANIAASCGVEVIGCARVSLRDVAEHLFEVHHSEKIWEGESFVSILDALHFEKLLLIEIPSGSFSHEKLVQLSSLAREHTDRRAIACFQDKVDDPKLLELIASMEPFRLVVHGMKDSLKTKAQSPHHLLMGL